MKKTVTLVQARLGSVRLPGKVMKDICGQPMIDFLLQRLSYARLAGQIVIATSDDPVNDPFASHVRALGYEVFQGSEHDVLDRFYQAARKFGATTVVRTTGDNPLIDPEIVDRVLTRLEESGVDYVSNCDPPTFPDGLDVEAFTFDALQRAWRETSARYDREHVTPYLRSNGFRTANVISEADYSSERWTVDESADLEVVRRIFGHFSPRTDFSWEEVLSLRNEKPEIFYRTGTAIRNAGATLNSGQKLWNRAKSVIPGGNSLLSKRSEMFLPGAWPAYFSRSKGCRVWDLDGRELIDMSYMGVGTNTLGYGHPEVNEAVFATIRNGNMSTLNCPEEVWLAERLLEMHPWAGMARFARTGAEANAIAVRIARAATGKDKIALCGYHGWQDWYLSVNLADRNGLAGHLLPGLDPRGVPKQLRDLSIPFTYNRLDELEEIADTHDLGLIIMEVMRNRPPEIGFLEKVRELASAKGIVLIFDECSSGFRQSFGGLHKRFGVEPDIAMFGKALGNGYAINAVIGRKEVMEHGQDTFISSTFWTERIGPAAALRTLEVMERVQSWETITATGEDIGNRWLGLADKHGLKLALNGIPAMIGFSIDSPGMLAYKTLLTQEMLKAGFLATPAVYVCTEHTPEILNRYFDALDPVFRLIRECEEGRPVADLLEGPICDSGFRRLN